MTNCRVLVLGGTGEARELASVLATLPDVSVVSSLAGRVTTPRLPRGEVRVGGFGGADGLTHWLRDNAVAAVIDATHPFAARITTSAAHAAAHAHVPLLVLRRPAWVVADADDWHVVADLGGAAGLTATLGRRAFLTIGRQEVAAFSAVEDVWFLIRAIEAPGEPLPRHRQVLLSRGPFTVPGEVDLLRHHRIDVVVTKNSGGPATVAKLTAARRLGVPVIMVERPPLPAGVATAGTVDEAVSWLTAHAG